MHIKYDAEGKRTTTGIETHGKNCRQVDPTNADFRKYAWSLIESGYYQVCVCLCVCMCVCVCVCVCVYICPHREGAVGCSAFPHILYLAPPPPSTSTPTP